MDQKARLRADLAAELEQRNPIDEPVTDFEHRMRDDALEALYPHMLEQHRDRYARGRQVIARVLRARRLG